MCTICTHYPGYMYVCIYIMENAVQSANIRFILSLSVAVLFSFQFFMPFFVKSYEIIITVEL